MARTHGLASTYSNGGCRCEDCRTAATAAKDAWRRRTGRPRRRIGDAAAHLTAELRAYKEERGCADCGIRDRRVLDFDHRPGEGKAGGVMAMTRTHTAEEIWAEVAKCDVRCANCHRIKTMERMAGTSRAPLGS